MLAWYRRIMIGFSLLLFGAGVVAYRVFLLPVVKLRFGAQPMKMRRLISWGFTWYLNLMRFLGLLSFEIERKGAEVPPGSLIVANHPTLLDAVILLATFPQSACVVKSDLAKTWCYGALIDSAGYLRSADSHRFISECIDHLKQGESLILFPEGTRSLPSVVGEFQPGAAAIAIRASCPVVPVRISCTPPVLYKGFHWWKHSGEKVKMKLIIEPPRSPPHYSGERSEEKILRGRFTEELRQVFA